MRKLGVVVKKLFKWFIYLLITLLIVLAIYKFITVKVLKKDYSNVFGYSIFEVISGSMSPSIEKYDLILVKIGKDYKIGDVVTFKDDGAIITHRITEIRDNILITKGDANNTKDRPVEEEKIIGKVIKVFSKGSVWINILKTPKIIFMLLFTISLVVYTAKEFIKDKKEKRRGDGMIDRIMNNDKLKIQIILFIILLVLLSFLIPYTISRFKTEARGDANIDIAFYLLKEKYLHENLSIEDFEPGMRRDYNFTVSNSDGTNRSEVTLEYDVELITTTNLPLEYKVYKIENEVDNLLALEENLDTDSNGTYFKKVQTEKIVLPYTDDYTDYYKVSIYFPEEYKNYKYQGVPEHIGIKVNSRQLI